MAITTYAELQSAIAAHMARDDLTPYLADFITLGEGILNFGMKSAEHNIDPLRVRDMEVVTTLTPVDGVVTLPTTFISARRVVETYSERRSLDYITPEMADELYPTRPSGLACHYTIIGSSLYTFPSATNDVEVQHYEIIPPLASNDPNWLLTKAPGVYLRASLFQAAMFVQDDNAALMHEAMLKALVAGMNATDLQANHSNAGVYLRGPTP
jgi:hypothetical protein